MIIGGVGLATAMLRGEEIGRRKTGNPSPRSHRIYLAYQQILSVNNLA